MSLQDSHHQFPTHATPPSTDVGPPTTTTGVTPEQQHGHLAQGSGGGGSGGGGKRPAKPNRKTSELSLEQLYHKRAIDRENQRYLRQKRKAQGDKLQAEIDALKSQLDESESQRRLLDDKQAQFKETIDSVIGSLQALKASDDGSAGKTPTAAPSFGGPEEQSPAVLAAASSQLPAKSPASQEPWLNDMSNAQAWNCDASLTFPIDGQLMLDIDDFSLELSSLASFVPNQFPLLFDGQQHQQQPSSFPMTSPSSLDQSDPQVLNADGFEDNRVTASQMRDQGLPALWKSVPRYTPPTGRVDQLLLELIAARTSYHMRVPDSAEFTNKHFPSVSSLLNSSANEQDKPVASTIAKDVCALITVYGFPERVAVLYILCILIRWHVLPTKDNYLAMPEFIRPTGTQILVPHPFWVATIPWYRARERIITQMDFADFPRFRREMNKNFSVNWPHRLSGILEGSVEKGFILTEAFVSHIRQVENWSVGREVTDMFPYLVGAMTVREQSL